MGFSFGKYDDICNTVSLLVCPLLGSNGMGLEPACYSRNVEIGGTIIFEPATCFVHISALLMTTIMVYHVRSKYTAVGRKEIVLFFYLYALSEILAIFLDSAIIPTYSAVYLWFTAVHIGLVTSIFWCLLVNGFVGFQFAEDGTPQSLWFLRLSSLLFFGIGFFIATATFKGIAGMSPTSQAGLYIVQFIFPIICTLIYVLLQVVLVIRTLDDRWPLGDIAFGVFFFVAGCVLMFAFSDQICEGAKHYLDGTFFGVLCMLLAVMMTYKYWDSITKEDLEFSVGSKSSVWEVQDPLLGPGGAGSEYDGQSSAGERTLPGRLAAPGHGAGGGPGGKTGYPPNNGAGGYAGGGY
ncbi:Chitin synthase, class 7 [Tilletia horrida]|nr:Chitin synthase, class 7 [Tilletia horrida]KAK0554979.1 Chitin synthase, class 7 [Tilletia horrida]